MKKTELTKDRNMLFFFGAAIGAFLFILTYGTAILDIGYDTWILRSSDIDIRQHYIGFLNFINDDWTFPIGNTDTLSYPHMMSVVWTDSIPGFCVLAKLFRFALPKIPQLFGIFGLVTFALNGAFAAVLVFQVTKNRAAALFSCPFFIMSFTVLQRMYYHTALASHWIILASLLYFYTDRKYDIKKDAFVYGILSFLCVSIHSYFLPMAGLILLFDTVYRNRDKKKITLPMSVPLLSFCVSGIVSLFIYGAFTSQVEHGGFAIGEFNSNLNTLYNSLGNGLLPELPLVRGTQYEGFGYLGLGILVLCIICTVFLIFKAARLGFGGIKEYLRKHFRILLTMVMGLCFAVISVFPEADFNETVLIPDILPFAIKKLFGIFRSNGRFIWPLMYIVMLSCIYILFKMTAGKPAFGYALLFACLILQGADLKGLVSEKNEWYTAEYKYNCWLDEYGPGADSFDHIVMTFDNGDLKMDNGYFAALHDKTINRFYFARVIDKIEQEQLDIYKEALESGNPEPRCVYFFNNETLEEWDTGELIIEKLNDDLYLGY